MINDGTVINVYNYNEGIISVPSHADPRGYIFEAANDGEPFIFPLTFSEIRFINGQSNIFKEGFLKFDEHMQEEIYNSLRIYDWDDILTESEIKDVLLKPTKEKLQKVLKITSTSMLERIRNILVKLRNVGEYDISSRVIQVVEARYNELYRNKKITDIVISKTRQEIESEMEEKIREEAIQQEVSKVKQKIQEEIEAKVRKELEIKIRKELEKEVKETAKSEKSDIKTKGKSKDK